MYFKDLTKKEKAHLRKELDFFTLAHFKKVAAEQKKMRENSEFPHYEPCYECKNIARKLGLPI